MTASYGDGSNCKVIKIAGEEHDMMGIKINILADMIFVNILAGEVRG
jgi:hypothetical protein